MLGDEVLDHCTPDMLLIFHPSSASETVVCICTLTEVVRQMCSQLVFTLKVVVLAKSTLILKYRFVLCQLSKHRYSCCSSTTSLNELILQSNTRFNTFS